MRLRILYGHPQRKKRWNTVGQESYPCIAQCHTFNHNGLASPTCFVSERDVVIPPMVDASVYSKFKGGATCGQAYHTNIYFLTIDKQQSMYLYVPTHTIQQGIVWTKHEDIVTYVRNYGSMEPHTLHTPPYMYNYCDLPKIYARWLKLPTTSTVFWRPNTKIKQSFGSPT